MVPEIAFLRQAGGKSHREHVRGDFSMTGRKERVCSDAGLAVDHSLVQFLPEDREHRSMAFPCQVGGKLDLEAGARYPARGIPCTYQGKGPSS